MHLIALVDGTDHVCCRYRVTPFIDPLRADGHTLEPVPYPRRWWDWVALGPRLRQADAVVLQRKLPAGWQLNVLRRSCRQLLYDFDDAVFLRDSYSPKGVESGSRRQAFETVLRQTDGVLAGNDFLAQQAAAVVGAERVSYMPTCVDPRRYALSRHQPRKTGIDLVWIGSSSTLQGLEQCRPILEALGRRLPGLRLKVVCDRFPAFRDLTVVPCRWAEETEADELASADVGISWLPDDDWSRGKCGLKVLQYQAAGLPVVANPVGVQPSLVTPGVTGYLARTLGEWGNAVAALAADPARRREMGLAGRRRVEAEYSVTVGAYRWSRVIHGLRPGIRAA